MWPVNLGYPKATAKRGAPDEISMIRAELHKQPVRCSPALPWVKKRGVQKFRAELGIKFFCYFSSKVWRESW